MLKIRARELKSKSAEVNLISTITILDMLITQRQFRDESLLHRLKISKFVLFSL